MDTILFWKNKLNPGEKLEIDFSSGKVFAISCKNKKELIGNIYAGLELLPITSPAGFQSENYSEDDLDHFQKSQKKRKQKRTSSQVKLAENSFFGNVKISKLRDQVKKEDKNKKKIISTSFGDNDTPHLYNADNIYKNISLTIPQKLEKLGWKRYNNKFEKDGVVLEYNLKFDTITFIGKIHYRTRQKILKQLDR